MAPLQIILSPKEGVVLSAVLEGMTEQLNAQIDQLELAERDVLVTIEKIRTYLPAVQS